MDIEVSVMNARCLHLVFMMCCALKINLHESLVKVSELSQERDEKIQNTKPKKISTRIRKFFCTSIRCDDVKVIKFDVVLIY